MTNIRSLQHTNEMHIHLFERKHYFNWIQHSISKVPNHEMAFSEFTIERV